MESFEASKKTIWEILFSPDKKFQIPVYQRPYSRGVDEARELREDINNWGNWYFIGSFIFNNENKHNTWRIDIIDWQQRSLTFTILFAVIRDLLNERWISNMASHIDESYISRSSNKLLSNKAEVCIIPWESTQLFFKTKIQEWLPFEWKMTKEFKKIMEVYSFFYKTILKEVQDLNNDDLVIALWKSVEKIRQLSAIVIDIQNEIDGYTIFETVNGRWVDLTPWDLLKNMIFRYYDKELSDLTKAKQMRDEIESNVWEAKVWIMDYLRHYRRSKHSYISNSNLLTDIKKRISNEKMVLFFEELHQQSYIYKMIINPELYTYNDLWLVYPENKKDESKKIYEILRSIQRMKIKQYAPIFLSVFRNFDIIINSTNPIKILENLEKFTFAYFSMAK